MINAQLLYANLAQLIEIQTVNADNDFQLGTLARHRLIQQQLTNIGDVQDVGTVHQWPAVDCAYRGFRFGFNIHKMLIQIVCT